MSACERTSVIVCTYNVDRLSLLRAALQGVAEQDRPADELVVVVDHNPALAEQLRGDYPDAVIVESADPKGLSSARNTGIATATGDVLAFLDDDATPRRKWLSALVAPFDDPTIAVVGGRAEPAWENGERPMWLPEELDWVVGCSFRGQAQGDVRNPIGASMALRASVFAQLGGFATELGRVGTLPLGCEETELGLRVTRAGGRVVLVDDSVVDHFVPAQRARVRYVLHRCYAEGVSKAVVSRLAAEAGATALGPERQYAWVLLAAIPRSIAFGMRRHSVAVAARALLIPVAGLCALAGYLRGRIHR